MTDFGYTDATAPAADKTPIEGSLHSEPFGGEESDTAQRLKGIVEDSILSEYEAQERFDNALGPDENRPDWLPDNFKTPEALAKSYNELRKTYSQSRQELRESQEALAALQAELQQDSPYWDSPNELMQTLSEQAFGVDETLPDASLAIEAANTAAYEAGEQVWAAALAERPEETALAIGQQVQATMSATYSDWPEMRELVNARILERDIRLPVSPASVVSVMSGVYADVKADVQARAQAKSSEAMKMNAQVLSGSPSSPAQTNGDEDYWSRVVATPRNRYGS
jgi:hypothetical protein